MHFPDQYMIPIWRKYCSLSKPAYASNPRPLRRRRLPPPVNGVAHPERKRSGEQIHEQEGFPYRKYMSIMLKRRLEYSSAQYGDDYIQQKNSNPTNSVSWSGPSHSCLGLVLTSLSFRGARWFGLRRPFRQTLTPSKIAPNESNIQTTELSRWAKYRKNTPAARYVSPKSQAPILCTNVAFGEPLQRNASTLLPFTTISGQIVFLCFARICSMKVNPAPFVLR